MYNIYVFSEVYMYKIFSLSSFIWRSATFISSPQCSCGLLSYVMFCCVANCFTDLLWQHVRPIYEKPANSYLSVPNIVQHLAWWGIHREADKNSALLGYYASSNGNLLPKFRDNLTASYPGVKIPSWPTRSQFFSTNFLNLHQYKFFV
jgi:hypothetical protein